jgi:hypothetical protein
MVEFCAAINMKHCHWFVFKNITVAVGDQLL